MTPGSGLMFGGLLTLTAGTYMAWETFGRWMQFGAMACALAVILVLALWRFKPTPMTL